MNRALTSLGPALFLALVMLVATALVVAAPHTPWILAAGPLMLVVALVGTDVFQRRRSGRGSLPSPSIVLLAVAILAGFAIIGTRNPATLAAMIPIYGSCAAMPFILRSERSRPACPRPQP